MAENKEGMERFKNKKQGEHLVEASLIGFIQIGTISDWHTKINEWIKIEVDNKTTNAMTIIIS